MYSKWLRRKLRAERAKELKRQKKRQDRESCLLTFLKIVVFATIFFFIALFLKAAFPDLEVLSFWIGEMLFH